MTLEIIIVDDSKYGMVHRLPDWFPGQVNTDFARDGEIALKALELRKYDLVILDYNMPVMNGPQVARKIKAKHPDVRIIGDSSDWTKREANEAGLEFYSNCNSDIREYVGKILQEEKSKE